MSDDFVKKVRAEFPFPWHKVVHPNGLVQVLDATNKEVQLFALCDFAIFLTNVILKQKEAA